MPGGIICCFGDQQLSDLFSGVPEHHNPLVDVSNEMLLGDGESLRVQA